MPEHPILERARAMLPADGALRMLWALTVIVVLVVVISCPDAAAAILAVGLLLRLGSLLGPGPAGAWPPSAGRPTPAPVCLSPTTASTAVVARIAAPAAAAPAGASAPEPPYPGAIDYAVVGVEVESAEWAGAHRPSRGDEAPAPEGNPYARYSAPQAAAPCLDDEADGSALDGDEKMTHQAFSRNDPLRATMGSMARRRDLDYYFREEVEDEEGRVWWGSHEE